MFLHVLSELSPELVPSGRVIGTGGVIGTAFLGVLGSGFGAELNTASGDCSDMLREHRVGALIEVAESDLPGLAPQLGATVVGRINSNARSLTVDGVELMSAEALTIWQSAFREELS